MIFTYISYLYKVYVLKVQNFLKLNFKNLIFFNFYAEYREVNVYFYILSENNSWGH